MATPTGGWQESNNIYGLLGRRGAFDHTFMFPSSDVPPETVADLDGEDLDMAALRYDTAGNVLYIFNPVSKDWHTLKSPGMRLGYPGEDTAALVNRDFNLDGKYMFWHDDDGTNLATFAWQSGGATMSVASPTGFYYMEALNSRAQLGVNLPASAGRAKFQSRVDPVKGAYAELHAASDWDTPSETSQHLYLDKTSIILHGKDDGLDFLKLYLWNLPVAGTDSVLYVGPDGMVSAGPASILAENFANADLTFDADHSHTLDGHAVRIQDGIPDESDYTLFTVGPSNVYARARNTDGSKDVAFQLTGNQIIGYGQGVGTEVVLAWVQAGGVDVQSNILSLGSQQGILVAQSGDAGPFGGTKAYVSTYNKPDDAVIQIGAYVMGLGGQSSLMRYTKEAVHLLYAYDEFTGDTPPELGVGLIMYGVTTETLEGYDILAYNNTTGALTRVANTLFGSGDGSNISNADLTFDAPHTANLAGYSWEIYDGELEATWFMSLRIAPGEHIKLWDTDDLGVHNNFIEMAGVNGIVVHSSDGVGVGGGYHADLNSNAVGLFGVIQSHLGALDLSSYYYFDDNEHRMVMNNLGITMYATSDVGTTPAPAPLNLMLKELPDAVTAKAVYIDPVTGALSQGDVTGGGEEGGGQTEVFSWSFSTITTAGDPGPGKFRLNHGSDFGLMTWIYVDNMALEIAMDISALFARMKGIWLIHIQQSNDATRFVQFTLNGDPENQTGWWKVPVVHEQHGAAGIGDGQKCTFVFVNQNETFTDGDKGDVIISGDIITIEPNLKVESKGISIDGMGAAIFASNTTYGSTVVPFEGTITGWDVAADITGSIVFDVKVGGTSIIGAGNKPTLTSQLTNAAAAVGWTDVVLAANDRLEFVAVSAALATRVTLTLFITRL